mmetsp:Transcript_82957/g.238413  ORF Transcript_82957/g.238413 Transcript_82957/m.238413 type:complete len:216 (+) Transcript_82957:267-914(+)
MTLGFPATAALRLSTISGVISSSMLKPILPISSCMTSEYLLITPKGFVLAALLRKPSMVAVESRSASTSRACCFRPSSIAAANSPPARMPRALMPSYIFVIIIRIRGAAATAAHPRGSQKAKPFSFFRGVGGGGITARFPKSASVRLSRGSLAASISRTTASGRSAMMTPRTFAASLALTCAVPTSTSFAPRGLSSSKTSAFLTEEADVATRAAA